MALKVVLASVLALFLVAAGVALTTLPGYFVSASFAFFMGLAILSWGLVLVAEWFGTSKTPSGGRIVRFVSRAFDRGGAVFLVGWFTIGLGLLAIGLAALVRGVLRG